MLNVEGGYLELHRSEGNIYSIIFHFRDGDSSWRLLNVDLINRLYVGLNHVPLVEQIYQPAGFSVGPNIREYKPNLTAVVLNLKDPGLNHWDTAVVSLEQLKDAVKQFEFSDKTRV